ncbi:ABC transporter substrate-binding protein [Ruixingdingia sedimenti]|uniref:ABC transporter substrate-binding protein n=1 Tax=Ruixingdingia sedimenti TaxID=3073604 RepID=A0ABU1FAH0_9RHOB|nr:ABC transporter substrate-binding protein [Xinfangfangia sp. LG-4]MDR5653593.1 ABC transporter substrate-binding protein [Xinfangfangia sp. LG-4]
MKKRLLASTMLCLTAGAALAQEPVKIGFITTLVGPAGYLGQDVRDGFLLAAGSDPALGGIPVEILIEDDALKPANGRQAAERFLNDEGIRLITGVVFSNIASAVVPEVVDSGAIFVSPNAGPSEFAGADCHENYFVMSWLTDTMQGSAGMNAKRLGYKRAVVVAPNYQAGKDAIAGFTRYFDGEIVAELFTPLGHAEFSNEIAQIRSVAPDVVFQFQPGASGIAFLKQYAQAGLDIPLVVSEPSLDHAILKAVGDAAVGVQVSGAWNADLPFPVNAEFVKTFVDTYGRMPTMYAAQGYDTAQAIGAALKAVGGSLDDTAAFRAAMLRADFDSVRGNFSFGPNQHPVQDWYAIGIEKKADGTLDLVTGEKLAEGLGDPFAADCKLPPAE